MSVLKSLILLPALALSCSALAQDGVLNLYSSRHYQTDEALYSGFTKLTGIKVNRIEAGEDALIERIRNEGARSPADVLVTVDAGRLWRAEQLGLFQPVKSALLDARIPASFREPNGLWYGFSLRARLIAYNKAKVRPNEIRNYEDLADAKWKGRVCMRSSTSIYNLSLMGALIEHLGEPTAEAWAKSVKDNLAREPKGGDTDQLKSVAAGECDVTISNQYYYARLARSEKAEERQIAQRVGVVFPNQASWGAHVNISGAGIMISAPHKANAIKFLEFMASDEAQDIVANANYEFPVVGTSIRSRELAALGEFKTDPLNVATYGVNQAQAQAIFDRAGWR